MGCRSVFLGGEESHDRCLPEDRRRENNNRSHQDGPYETSAEPQHIRVALSVRTIARLLVEDGAEELHGDPGADGYGVVADLEEHGVKAYRLCRAEKLERPPIRRRLQQGKDTKRGKGP